MVDASRAEKIPQEWAQFGAVFSALGDPERQRLVLAFDSDEELNAGQLAAASKLTRPAVSFHLKVLDHSGVLLREKRGREVFFKLNLDLLEETFGRCVTYVSHRKNKHPKGSDELTIISKELK
jgi:DNA-binding transcriptional ArsR family regulator